MLKIIVTGNLGHDAEVRNVNGTNAISFTVAHTEKYKDRSGQSVENTTWVRCTLWRKPEASAIAQYLKKGTKVLIEGKPEARAYVTNQQQAAASLEVRVDNIEFLGGSNQQAQQQPRPQPQQTYQQPVQQTIPRPVQQAPAHGHGAPQNLTIGNNIHQMSDDDLPF